ncbi:MAG: hypothetical protein ABUL68_01885 [Pseudomonadota bacterium]
MGDSVFELGADLPELGLAALRSGQFGAGLEVASGLPGQLLAGRGRFRGGVADSLFELGALLRQLGNRSPGLGDSLFELGTDLQEFGLAALRSGQFGSHLLACLLLVGKLLPELFDSLDGRLTQSHGLTR